MSGLIGRHGDARGLRPGPKEAGGHANHGNQGGQFRMKVFYHLFG